MIRPTLPIIFVLTATAAIAREPQDSTDIQKLQEIVIEAPKIVRKADMDVFYPSRSAVENAKNGMQLLRNLMIPSLMVSDALDKIQAAGQSVQVRINGREATVDQVRTLLPETIRRVEWIDNPGLRYNGAEHVLNFIVANPTVGGSLQSTAHPALNQAWGFYMADAKFNTGRSQWEAGGNLKLTENVKTHREYHETFTYADGTSLTRNETPRGGEIKNTMAGAWVSYNYIKPDTTIVYIEAKSNFFPSNRISYDGLLSLNDGTGDILLTDSHGDSGSTPRLSAYLEQHFANGQTFVVNLQGSFHFGRTYSDYIERIPDTTNPLNDIHTMIKDRNQAYAVEADYIKNWGNSRLTAGASYTANRNRSCYESLDGSIFHQRQDKVYVFAEYFRRIGSVTLTAGLGAQYTDFLFKETRQGNNSWDLRPKATVTYGINPDHRLSLDFKSWQSAPSLTESNITPQQIDGFQWRAGNPDLKTSSSYMLTLRYNFHVPRVYGSFGVRAFTSPDAITPLLYWDDDRLITTYENSRGLQNISLFLSPQIEIIPGWIEASGYIQYRAERMSGTGYRHYNQAWSGNASIQLTYRGFVLSGQYMRSQQDLWGEKISWGENMSVIDLSYNWKDWQFSAGMIMPFGEYDQGSRSLSKWNTNEQHMRLDMRMPYVSVSYNIRWGHQKRGVQKLVNTDADVSTSTAGGR